MRYCGLGQLHGYLPKKQKTSTQKITTMGFLNAASSLVVAAALLVASADAFQMPTAATMARTSTVMEAAKVSPPAAVPARSRGRETKDTPRRVSVRADGGLAPLGRAAASEALATRCGARATPHYAARGLKRPAIFAAASRK